ncbi:MAG: hypothetical protein AAGB31_14825 [Bdellovibrio sp.]
MKKNRIFTAIGVLVLGLGAYWLTGPAKTFIDKGKDSEVKSLLNNYGVAEESYFASYKEFSADEGRLGFSSQVKGVKVFFLKDLVPAEYVNALPEASLPFVGKDSYRILVAVEKSNGQVEFWTMDEKRNPSKLKKK